MHFDSDIKCGMFSNGGAFLMAGTVHLDVLPHLRGTTTTLRYSTHTPTVHWKSRLK
jgi:hypothetical protein